MSEHKDLKVAFGTLALGRQYRTLATLLAYDLYALHPEIKLYILTDEPRIFENFPNVIAIKHKFGGVRSCYHDKRYVVSVVLKNEDICLFFDADSRIIDRIDFEEILIDDAFLVSPWSINLDKKLESEKNEAKDRKSSKGFERRRNIFVSLCKKLGVNIADTFFVNEAFFSINKNNGDYKTFIHTWDYCATYTTARLLEASEGSSIGISAKKANCKIHSMKKNPSWYFNDFYINHWENDAQKKAHERMAILRNSIGKEIPTALSSYIRMIGYLWRYLLLILKKLRLKD